MASLVLNGNTSGSVTISSPAVSGTTTLTLPTTSGTVLTNAGQLVGTGTTTNDSAAAGYVGEHQSATVSTPVSLTTNTYTNIVTLSLTAGDWDISGVVGYQATSGTPVVTFIQAGLNTTSATIGSLGSYMQLSPITNAFATIADGIYPLPTFRFTLSSTTTVYLVSRAIFTSTALGSFGFIRARRVR